MATIQPRTQYVKVTGRYGPGYGIKYNDKIFVWEADAWDPYPTIIDADTCEYESITYDEFFNWIREHAQVLVK